MLSRFVISFPPRKKCLLISWLQSPSTVILEPKKIKSVTVAIVSPNICQEALGPDAMIFVYEMLSFKPTFTLLFHFRLDVLFFLFFFCHKSGVICITDVIEIYPSNLDSGFASSSLAFRMMYSEYKLNKQGEDIHILFRWCKNWSRSKVEACNW